VMGKGIRMRTCSWRDWTMLNGKELERDLMTYSKKVPHLLASWLFSLSASVRINEEEEETSSCACE